MIEFRASVKMSTPPSRLGETGYHNAILFALIRGPVVASRALRRRRGQCLACAYDLRGHGDHHGNGAATCPECGMA